MNEYLYLISSGLTRKFGLMSITVFKKSIIELQLWDHFRNAYFEIRTFESRNFVQKVHNHFLNTKLENKCVNIVQV